MALVIAGTGTGVGKTLTSALIMAKYARTLRLKYFKAVQTGDESDRETIARFTGLESACFLPEFARFPLAASPHYAAEQAGQLIDFQALVHFGRKLSGATVIELAGGIMVPLTRGSTNLDLVQQWGFPTLLVADTGLGTINHTLLSLAALRSAGLAAVGVFFVGADNSLYEDNARTIADLGETACLGSLFLPAGELVAESLAAAAREFDRDGQIGRLLS